MPKGNFNDKLIALLKTHPNFSDESGELLPAAVKKQIRAEYPSRILTEDSRYLIIGVPSFYNTDYENEFKEDLANALKTVS